MESQVNDYQLKQGNQLYVFSTSIVNNLVRLSCKNSYGKKYSRDFSVYESFISILAVGLAKSKTELADYTIYQIRDEFQRFVMKENYDIYIKAKLAGAQDLEEVENWMNKIHS